MQMAVGGKTPVIAMVGASGRDYGAIEVEYVTERATGAWREADELCRSPFARLRSRVRNWQEKAK